MMPAITFWKATEFHPVILEQIPYFMMQQEHGLKIPFILSLIHDGQSFLFLDSMFYQLTNDKTFTLFPIQMYPSTAPSNWIPLVFVHYVKE